MVIRSWYYSSNCSISVLVFTMHPRVREISLKKQPVQARSKATVEALLEAAAQILEAEGLVAVNTNRIAERAGVGIGSLYHYFPSKEVILASLLRRERAEFRARLEDVVNSSASQDLQQVTRRLLQVAVAHQLDRPRLARALEYVELALPVEAETDALNAEISRLVCSVFERLCVDHPALVARDVVALARGMVDAAGLAGETEHAALVERLERAVSGYLRS